MRVFLAISSLLLTAIAADPAPGGHGSHGGYGVYTPYSYRDLAQLAQFIKTVTAEKEQLDRRVNLLKTQKSNFLNKVNTIQSTTIPEFNNVQDSQDGSLNAIKDKIQALLTDVLDEKAALAGEAAVAKRQEKAVNNMWSRIYGLVSSNNAQNALLSKIDRFLMETKEKLNEKLAASTVSAEGKVTELKDNTKAFGGLVNARTCYSDVVEIPIDPTNHTGEADQVIPDDRFGGATPTTFCAITGFTSSLNLEKSHGYGYGYPDMYQNLALSTDCKALPDNKIWVGAVDLSKGTGNVVNSVNVLVKACTLGPQATP